MSPPVVAAIAEAMLRHYEAATNGEVAAGDGAGSGGFSGSVAMALLERAVSPEARENLSRKAASSESEAAALN